MYVCILESFIGMFSSSLHVFRRPREPNEYELVEDTLPQIDIYPPQTLFLVIPSDRWYCLSETSDACLSYTI